VIDSWDDALVSSDWHVWHRNIYWFLPEPRRVLSGAAAPQRLTADEFLAAERMTYDRLLQTIEAAIANGEARRFLFVGDLVFGLSRRGGSRALVDALRREVPSFFEIFRMLRAAGVRRVFVLGNHDDFKLRNDAARGLYTELFDEVTPFVREGRVLVTHYPVGYSRACDETRGTPDEKFYRMNKTFHALDRRLLNELSAEGTVNLHGHIHVGAFAYPVTGVTYRNVALDVVAARTQGTALEARPVEI